MTTSAQQILNNTFGYSEFRHHQSDIIQALLDGQDTLVLMPTGGGKSLCFQIPALIRDGVGIVISPLIALMQDQVDALVQSGIRAAYLNSTLDNQTQQQTEQQLLNGEIDLLYISPERLMTNRMLSLLGQSSISLFAIDEAHCVSQWGHDFRKEYQQLRILHERFPNVPRIALTATADKRTRSEIIEQLNLHDARIFINSFDRPNICYTISEGQNSRERLWNYIQQRHPDDAGIIYCLSRKKVESVAEWLSTKGRTALPYHAGLSAKIRQQHQQRFLREDKVIIVATIAFGMGIDKPDVRFVAHLSLPKSIEAYYQETGRAGRDGAPANAWMAYGLQDVITLRQMAENNDSSEQFKRILHTKLETMLALCEQRHCRRQSILAYFDETLKEPCGNCDTCLTPPEAWDATEAARKALSCVYKTGQRFGVTYLSDILLGKTNDRVISNGHDKLGVFGIGKELDAKQWRNLYRQLITRNLLTVDVQGHGSLLLHESCRAVLKGDESLHLRKQTVQTKSKASKSKVSVSNSQLWEALRATRKRLSEELGVPPFVIFHDATLMDMMDRMPLTHEQMARVSGVGATKLENYADEFLAVLVDHNDQQSPAGKTDTLDETYQLFKCGMDAEAIASHRDLSLTTVYNHLAKLIQQGQLLLNDVINISPQDIATIQNAIIELGDEANKLKPVFEYLDGGFSYEILRCVKASTELA